jgi:uracil phosphoribosyltransferase
MPIREVRHPLVKHKVGLMRDKTISTMRFRALTREIARLLAVEATRDLPLEPHSVEGWAGTVVADRIAGKKLTVVPILRAGLGMLDGVLDIVPDAKVSMVGLVRDETTLKPHTYLEKFVDRVDERMAIVVDPMLATGGSLSTAISMLKRRGCTDIRALVLVAAPEGMRRMETDHPEVKIYAASIDERLDEHGYILPGLGDAGDRIFGTELRGE